MSTWVKKKSNGQHERKKKLEVKWVKEKALNQMVNMSKKKA